MENIALNFIEKGYANGLILLAYLFPISQADPSYKITVVSETLENIVDAIVYGENVVLNRVVRDTLTHMTREVESKSKRNAFEL